MGNRGVGAVVISTEALAIPTGDQASFETGKPAVIITFDFEDPLAGDRPCPSGQLVDENQAVDLAVTKRLEFFTDGNTPLVLVRG